MAPEVLCGYEYDTKADIYSLGITIRECVDKVAPYSNLPKEEAIRKIITEELPPLQNRSVSSELREFIGEATCKDPRSRANAIWLSMV